MCGRLWLQNKLEYKNYFGFNEQEVQILPEGEIFPSQKTGSIIQTGKERKLNLMQFGMFPSWSKSLLINARRENLMTSKLWKPSIETRRCLVPASAFFEWQTVDGQKIKWKIALKGSDLFCFAGIYDTVRDKKNNEIVSFAILTEPANKLMRHIHNHGENKHRQPVIVMEEQYSQWLDTSRPAERILESVGTYSEDILEAEPEKDGLF
jgi:putative SOS response-associated peptidase YedK